MTVWFCSDWHFGHRNILTLGSGRPFDTIEQHDTALIGRHNALVDPDDTVWVLGDVAMGAIADSLACCKQMNGRKILVCGNHDRPAMHADVPERRDRWVDRYCADGGFRTVLFGPLLRSFTGLPGPVLLNHYPYTGESFEGRPDRYADRRPVDQGGWLLHGHVHEQWKVNRRQVNVGVDVWDYQPVPAEAIAELIA